jgi:ketosteroid isomerase-like protein
MTFASHQSGTFQSQEQSTARDRAADEAEIRALIESLADAVRRRDVDAMLACCGPEIASFDLVPPLKHAGEDAIRRVWANALSGVEGQIEYDRHYLELMVGDDVAFSRSLNRFGGTRGDGSHAVSWLCETLGFRRNGGRWQLVHQHVSVPFDMDSGKALLALEP